MGSIKDDTNMARLTKTVFLSLFIGISAGSIFWLRPTSGATPAVSPSLRPNNVSVEFVRNLHDRKPTTSFSCQDKVYALLTLTSAESGNVELKGAFHRPDGRIQEQPSLRTALRAGEQLTAYLYLDLAPEKSFFDFPSGDRADPAPQFNGQWTFEVLHQGPVIAKSNFYVRCT